MDSKLKIWPVISWAIFSVFRLLSTLSNTKNASKNLPSSDGRFFMSAGADPADLFF
jgi:hypothetical protein